MKTGSPRLNLSFQEGVSSRCYPEEKFDFMEAHGVTGLEPHGKALLARKQGDERCPQGT